MNEKKQLHARHREEQEQFKQDIIDYIKMYDQKLDKNYILFLF